MDLIIIKRDGSQTTSMPQQQAESYLLKSDLVPKNLESNLKQVLNDVYSGKGKASSSYVYNGHPVLHASSGNSQKSVTAFFYKGTDANYLIALGEHSGEIKGNTSYRITIYGQTAGDFKENGRVTLS
ncbi:MAG: hypothetical protein ACK5NK_00475 [Niabella sp.]